MIQTFFIPHQLPSLNEIINLCRSNYNQASKHKKQWQKVIKTYVKKAKIEPASGRSNFKFSWFEPNKKRDKDNISAGGRKYIFDSLVELGIKKNDGWANVGSWTDDFRVADANKGERVGVLVSMWPTDVDLG